MEQTPLHRAEPCHNQLDSATAYLSQNLYKEGDAKDSKFFTLFLQGQASFWILSLSLHLLGKFLRDDLSQDSLCSIAVLQPQLYKMKSYLSWLLDFLQKYPNQGNTFLLMLHRLRSPWVKPNSPFRHKWKWSNFLGNCRFIPFLVDDLYIDGAQSQNYHLGFTCTEVPLSLTDSSLATGTLEAGHPGEEEP